MTRPVGAAHYAILMADPRNPTKHAMHYCDALLCAMLEKLEATE
jgi:hypothetical protein